MIFHNLVNMGKCFHTMVGCPNGTFASHASRVILLLIQYIYIYLKKRIKADFWETPLQSHSLDHHTATYVRLA